MLSSGGALVWLVCAVTTRLRLQVKIQAQNEEMLHTACQQFMGKHENEIRKIAMETLEGHQRAIMGCMTVEVQGYCCFCCHHVVFQQVSVDMPRWCVMHDWVVYSSVHVVMV